MIRQRSGSGSRKISAEVMNDSDPLCAGFHIADQVFGLAVLFANAIDHQTDRLGPARFVVGLERLTGKLLGPNLPGQHIHIAVH